MFVHIEGEADHGLQGLIKLGQSSDFFKGNAGRSSENFMNAQVTSCHTGIISLMCLCLYQGWDGFVA